MTSDELRRLAETALWAEGVHVWPDESQEIDTARLLADAMDALEMLRDVVSLPCEDCGSDDCTDPLCPRGLRVLLARFAALGVSS